VDQSVRHNGMARAQVEDGGTAGSLERICRNVLNKQSGSADKGLSSFKGLVEVLTTPRHT
jgi:hypothetical protein